MFRLLAACILTITAFTAKTEASAAAELNLEVEERASFQTDFTIKNVGEKPISITEIHVNEDKFCRYRIWRKINRWDCKKQVPGTGGFVSIGPVRGLLFAVPEETTRLSVRAVEELMTECGWSKIDSLELGVSEANFTYKFSIFRDNDNDLRCSKYRRISVRSKEGDIFTWRFDPSGKLIRR
jgi:hypothetical protein